MNFFLLILLLLILASIPTHTISGFISISFVLIVAISIAIIKIIVAIVTIIVMKSISNAQMVILRKDDGCYFSVFSLCFRTLLVFCIVSTNVVKPAACRRGSGDGAATTTQGSHILTPRPNRRGYQKSRVIGSLCLSGLWGPYHWSVCGKLEIMFGWILLFSMSVQEGDARTAEALAEHVSPKSAPTGGLD